MSVLNKSAKFVSFVRVDYENKTHPFKPINSILYRCMKNTVDRKERYSFHSVKVCMCLEQNVVFLCQLPLKT